MAGQLIERKLYSNIINITQYDVPRNGRGLILFVKMNYLNDPLRLDRTI